MKPTTIEDILKAKDFDYAIQILRWTFKPLGIWPFKSSDYPKILRPFLIFICFFLQLFLVVPAIFYILYVEKNLMARLKLFGAVSFGFVNACIYVFLVIKTRHLATYLKDVAVDWHATTEAKDREIMLANTRISRTVMLLYLVGVFSSGILFCGILPLTSKPLIIGNDSFHHLPLDSYFIIFDSYQTPYYNIVYVVDCLSAVVFYLINSGVCNLSIQGILHISSRCIITTLMIKNLTNRFSDQLLGKIVRHQWRSLKFALTMQEMFSEIYLIEFTSSTLLICLLGYYLIADFQNNDTVSILTFTMFLISFTFNIFIYCYLGERLTEQYASVRTAVYMMDWYKLPVKQSRNLYFIILYTQRPVFLTAGKLVTFSLPSFTSVMKASATYLNMLRAVTTSGTNLTIHSFDCFFIDHCTWSLIKYSETCDVYCNGIDMDICKPSIISLLLLPRKSPKNMVGYAKMTPTTYGSDRFKIREQLESNILVEIFRSTLIVSSAR